MKALTETRTLPKLSKAYIFLVRYALSTFAVCTAAFILLKFPSFSASGVKKGIDICLTSLIPSLYPFMILTNYYALSEISQLRMKTADRLCNILFKLPGSCGAVILFSFVGGLPVGGKMASELYGRGLISKEHFARLLCFCVNPGPAFVISAVGADMLGSKGTGVIIYVSLVLSSAILGVLSRFFESADQTYISCALKDNSSEKGKKAPIEMAVIKSSKALFSICAWVTAFSCLNEITVNLDISDALSSFILCTSEMTNGSMMAAESFSVPVVAAVIGFSGFCGHLQMIGEIRNAELKYKYFLVSRIINSGVSAVICSFLLKYFPVAEETFAVGIKPEAGENSGSVLLSVMMLLMAVLFLVGDDYKVGRKNTKKV